SRRPSTRSAPPTLPRRPRGRSDICACAPPSRGDPAATLNGFGYTLAVRFDDAFLDELKSRLRLSDVIGKTVRLKRQGREFAGLSPFTKEKTPSFFVNDDKGFFYDFSSGKHGDAISFLQETERLSFVEAVERLAGEA